jgi:uncharacterized protein YegL
MSLQEAVESIPRKTMVLFFLVDASGSMSGSKIGALNTAIEEVMPELRDLSLSNADAQIKIAAIEFSSGTKWLTSVPVSAEIFCWNYLDAGGSTDMGAAFHELNTKLSIKEFMHEATGSFAPVLFLLSDGEPTDDFDGGLDELKKNNWYKHSIKVAIAIGDDANKQKLAEFTGSMESVIEVHNSAALKKMIRFVSLRSSQIASKSIQVTAPSSSSTPVPASSTANNTAGSGMSVPTGSTSNNTAGNIAGVIAGGDITAKQQALNEQIAEVAAEINANAGYDEW